MIPMSQFCKCRSPEKMKNLRRGLFILLKSTLLCGIFMLLAAFLNFLLCFVWPGYFSVLFTAVNSDIPSPASSLHISQIRVSPWILKKKPPGAYMCTHRYTLTRVYLSWAKVFVLGTHWSASAQICWWLGWLLKLHSAIRTPFMLDKGSTSQRIAKYVYEVALCFGRTHDENCVTSEVFIFVALTTAFLFLFLCISK